LAYQSSQPGVLVNSMDVSSVVNLQPCAALVVNPA